MNRTRIKLTLLASSLVALSGVFSSATPIDDAAPIPIALDGNHSWEGWNGLTTFNHPGYPAFPGSGNWPAPIASNINPGDATLSKVSNGSGGGPFPSGESIYFGGFSADPNTEGGTLGITDSTPLANLKTVVFQVEIGQAFGYDFYNGLQPVLYLNGSSVSLDATYALTLSQAQNGTIDMPTGPDGALEPQPIYITDYAFQWNLSAFTDPITSLSVQFTGVQHSQVYAMQLDESDAAYTAAAVVPEPSTLGLLIFPGMISLALLRWKRRFRAVL